MTALYKFMIDIDIDKHTDADERFTEFTPVTLVGMSNNNNNNNKAFYLIYFADKLHKRQSEQNKFHVGQYCTAVEHKKSLQLWAHAAAGLQHNHGLTRT